MKLSHSVKGFLFHMAAVVMLLAIPAVSISLHSYHAYWLLIPAAPVGFLLIRQSGRYYGADLADGICRGIDKGLSNYFESPAFPRAMDDAWTSACASLAAEAEAVGQSDLSTGYKMLGGIQPAPKDWKQIQDERKARQGGYLAFCYSKSVNLLNFTELCGSLHHEGNYWCLFDIKRNADGCIESATIVPNDHPAYKHNADANYDLVCSEFFGRGTEMCDDIDITKEVAERLIATYEAQPVQG